MHATAQCASLCRQMFTISSSTECTKHPFFFWRSTVVEVESIISRSRNLPTISHSQCSEKNLTNIINTNITSFSNFLHYYFKKQKFVKFSGRIHYTLLNCWHNEVTYFPMVYWSGPSDDPAWHNSCNHGNTSVFLITDDISPRWSGVKFPWSRTSKRPPPSSNALVISSIDPPPDLINFDDSEMVLKHHNQQSDGEVIKIKMELRTRNWKTRNENTNWLDFRSTNISCSCYVWLSVKYK